MLFEICEDIVLSNKPTNDFKNFEFQDHHTFSITAPVIAEEFESMAEPALIDKLYQTAFLTTINKKVKSMLPSLSQ